MGGEMVKTIYAQASKTCWRRFAEKDNRNSSQMTDGVKIELKGLGLWASVGFLNKKCC
jgi:hypothetical protein